MERMDFGDGKYTVINDNGSLKALRYGEPWKRDLTGDNLIYWMLVEAIRLKEERDHLKAKLEGLEGQEPVAWYADYPWGREYNGLPELSNGVVGRPLYASSVPAEPERLDKSEVEDLAWEANQEALSFGVSLEPFTRLVWAVERCVLRKQGYKVE